MQEKKVSRQRYRSLVLGAVYIEAKKRRIPVAGLPPDVLSGLGVVVEMAEDPGSKVSALSRCSLFKVDVPEDLDSSESKARIMDLEKRLEDNKGMLGTPPGTKRSAWKRRRPEEAKIEEDRLPAGSVEDLPERI